MLNICIYIYIYIYICVYKRLYENKNIKLVFSIIIAVRLFDYLCRYLRYLLFISKHFCLCLCLCIYWLSSVIFCEEGIWLMFVSSLSSDNDFYLRVWFFPRTFCELKWLHSGPSLPFACLRLYPEPSE